MVGVVTKNQGANYAGLLGFCQENMALKWRNDVIFHLFSPILCFFLVNHPISVYKPIEILNYCKK